MRSLALLIMWIVAASFSPVAQDEFSIADFTKSPTEHIINRIDKPFVVRLVRGVVTSTGVREPFQGVLFELQGPGPDRTIRNAITDKNGQFKIKHIRAGTYHFKATMNGWQSVIGTITVSKKADKRSEIKIDMLLGV
jgi:hypothetical protein